MRRLLLLTLMGGIAGIGLELLLIDHVEDELQLVPIVLLPTGLMVSVWHALRPGQTSGRAMRLVMACFIVSGLVGVGLHYRGNHEFEREMYPDMGGVELVRKTVTGATPVLAPGSMALLGLIGLAAVYGVSPRPHSSGHIEEDES